MKAVIQVVNSAEVSFGGSKKTIGKGLLVFLGVKKGDTSRETEFFAKKLPEMRIFEDSEGKMNLSAEDIGGSILLIPNFTLNAHAEKGRRPDYFDAEEPQKAEKEYLELACMLNARVKTETGFFGCDMRINSEMAGPVTIVLEKTFG